MEQAQIIRIVSNQYLVLNEKQESCLCVAMGKLRKGKQSPVVGDQVMIERFEKQNGIQKILPRKNELLRPAIANVDQAIIITSVKDPDFSATLLDRFIFVVTYANIKPILCFTKMDLVEQDDEIYEVIKEYQASGYECYLSGEGVDDSALKQALKDKISVLTGQSGAGKSSLINRLDVNFQLATQVISKALGRGKHTTRHCELHQVCGGWIADTPGFSSLDFTLLDDVKLSNSILDFKPYQGLCKFNDCKHIHEPGCAILEAVNEGKISKTRHQNYLDVMEIIKNKKIKY